MSPLSIDPFGVVGLALQLLTTGNQGRIRWLKNRRILKRVEALIASNEKLSRQERKQILKALQSDTKLRQYVVSPKQIGKLQEYLMLLSVDEPAFGRVAEPLSRLVETLAIEEHASTTEGLTYERILEQSNIQGETLTLVREQREMWQKQSERESNPLGSMKTIAHDKFRGYGIRAISINPDTKQSSIILNKPGQLTLRGTGSTARKLRQLQEAILAGEVASLEFTPEDDLHVSINPPVMERFISLNFSKIEVKPTPQVVEQVIRYTVGDFSKAISTQIIFDRATKLLTLKLKTQQPSLNFEISWDDKGEKSNFNISMSTEDGKRPGIPDLSVLHLISYLNDKRNLLDLVDEGSGDRFASIDLSSSQPLEDLVHLSGLAYLTALHLEANHELRRAQLTDEDLPWPTVDAWNDPEIKLRCLFERIRDVLKNGNRTSSITGKATFVEVYEDALDVNIENGILEGNITISELLSFGKHSRLTQNFTFNNPHVRLWQDSKELKVKTIREAFEKYGAPITFELQDDQTVVSFAKDDSSS